MQPMNKFEQIMLDRKRFLLLLCRTRCMCSWTANTTSMRSKPKAWAMRSNYLEDSMPCEVVFYNEKAISVELPNTIVRGSHLHRTCGARRHFRQGDETGQDQWRF